MSTNVLVIGGGGREHALASAIAASPGCGTLLVAPGNPGTEGIARNVVLDVADHAAVRDLCRVAGIDLVVIGPEAPLVEGLADALRAGGIAVFGPSAAAARLEGSKSFTKEVCDEAEAPTAAWSRHESLGDALAALKTRGAPIVVKADGLAAGKGVTVATTREEAEEAIRACFDGAHGGAGAVVVLEDVLRGVEASLFCLCDGEDVLALPLCRDHKRVGEGDTGPNTGGMGAYCPVPDLGPEVAERAVERIVRPVLRAMRERGAPFTGVLYAGLMVDRGEPSLIEFNVRFGDPEAQVLLPLLGARALELLQATATGGLATCGPVAIERAALCVTLAAPGYPGTPERGLAIEGVEEAERVEGVNVFHAGTARGTDGALRTDGGRVLTVSAVAETLETARERAYAATDAIAWDGLVMRRDIGPR